MSAPDLSPQPAYRVPWRIARDDRAHPLVVNISGEAADLVRVFRSDHATSDHTQFWGRVHPAGHIEVCLCDADLDRLIVSIAWFRVTDRSEYLWRFTL